MSDRITDSSLQQLPNLKNLALIGTKITDQGLEHLVRLTGLRTLWVEYAQITDNGLKHLKQLTGLQVLGLTGTQITEKGVLQLRQALPNCRVHFLEDGGPFPTFDGW